MAKKGRTPAPNHNDWLVDILPHHDRLAASARSLLENMLRKKQIEFLSITSRLKTLDGALEKIVRKNYNSPREQLTDLSGIRVVTFLEEQVAQISEVIKGLFEIDSKNSLDRTNMLGDDKVGYRSTHFVCTLGKQRRELPENEAIGDLKFEIQVRTVLQHAWAELAHDRSFKFGSALPPKIQRKLNLYSGMLEVVDNAFDEISREIESYSASLKRKTIKQISHLGLDSLLLQKFLREIPLPAHVTLGDEPLFYPIILQELNKFGISNVGDLEQLVDRDFLQRYMKDLTPRTIQNISIMRAAMVLKDFTRSTKAIPPPHRLSQSLFEELREKCGVDIVKKGLAEGAIKIV